MNFRKKSDADVWMNIMCSEMMSSDESDLNEDDEDFKCTVSMHFHDEKKLLSVCLLLWIMKLSKLRLSRPKGKWNAVLRVLYLIGLIQWVCPHGLSVIIKTVDQDTLILWHWFFFDHLVMVYLCTQSLCHTCQVYYLLLTWHDHALAKLPWYEYYHYNNIVCTVAWQVVWSSLMMQWMSHLLHIS